MHQREADTLVQRDDDQIPQVGTTVHRKLLTAPFENFFERDDGKETYWKHVL
jgi:hypothetical protein